MWKANRRVGQLCAVLNKYSPININKALTIYKSLIRETLSHAALAQEHADKTHFKRPQIFQNWVLRMTTKPPMITRIENLHETVAVETVNSDVQE
jgi:hypothetical protein